MNFDLPVFLFNLQKQLYIKEKSGTGVNRFRFLACI
jgi:hypothetical protein